MAIFQSADFLIPQEQMLPDWAVIACDQFTSEPEYWEAVRAQAEGKPSAYHIIFPEAEFGNETQNAKRIVEIQQTMYDYANADFFRRYPDAMIYVERTLTDGSIRRGIVGTVDLEEYEYAHETDAKIRATERTVYERIPARVKIREGAVMETSHVLMLADDVEDLLIGSVAAKKEQLPLLYDFDLMQGGGHITGRLIAGADLLSLMGQFEKYYHAMDEKYRRLRSDPLYFAVGDGNHSLASAKAIWEKLHELVPENHPARYAMVELVNIHEPSLLFEPIHRVVKVKEAKDIDRLLDAVKTVCAEDGYPLQYTAGKKSGTLYLDPNVGTLPIGILQPILDHFTDAHGGTMDYIHGEEVTRNLGRNKNCISFVLPPFQKDDFFRSIATDGVLPRKTFSMGHAEEKRYYLEARRISG